MHRKALDQAINLGAIDPISRAKIITEVARTVLVEHGFTAADITSSPSRALELQRLILEAQVIAERHALQEAEWFVSDRSGVDPIVYAQKYVSEEAAYTLTKSPAWIELRERMRESVVIVCEAGADWLTDDGVRLMPNNPEEWIEFHVFFCSCMDAWGLKYEVLPCKMVAIEERVGFVLDHLS